MDECTENVEEVKIELHSSGHENVCLCPYAISVILAVRAIAISIGIGAYFAFSCWYWKKDVTRIKFGARTQWNCAQTTI